MNKGLADGALTFSDGSNSGIVIKNVSGSGGSYMTFDVDIPEASDFDMWKDTAYSDTSSDSKDAVMVSCGDNQYLLSYNGAYSGSGSFKLSKYDGSGWTQMGSALSTSGLPMAMKLIEHNGALYFGYIAPSSPESFTLKSFDLSTKTWSSVCTLNDCGQSFTMDGVGDDIYLAFASNSKASLYKLNGSSPESPGDCLTELGDYFTGLGGQPGLCSINGKVCTSIRQASDNLVRVFNYDSENGGFTEVGNDSLIGQNYDMVALDDKIYVVLCQSNTAMKMASYDASDWTMGKAFDVPCLDPSLASSQGKLYVLTTGQNDTDKTKIYNYNINTDSILQEGVDVDGAAGSLTLTSSDNNLFVSYVQSSANTIKVKSKKTVDELLSITVKPPNKTVYEIGDEVDTSGLSVIANYTLSGEETIASFACTVTDFDTKTLGIRQATVSYNGKSNTFTYEVKPPIDATDEKMAELISSMLLEPSKVNAKLSGYHDVSLTWTTVKGATGYDVYYKKSSASTWSFLGSSVSASIKASSLADGVNYSFRVFPYVKYNAAKRVSEKYRDAAGICTLQKLSTPSVKKKSKKYVRVRWTNIPGESGYQIARSKYKSKKFSVIRSCSYAYNYTDIKTKRHKKYYYKIRAYATVDGRQIYGPWSSVKAYRLR